MLQGADLDEFRRRGRTSRFRRGQRLVFEGVAARSVMVVESGQVKIVSSTPDGAEVIIAVRGEGDLVGDLAALSGAVTSAAVVALDEVTATVLPAERYLTFLLDHPTLMLDLARRLIAVLAESDAKLVELATAGVEQRVVRRLLALTDHGVCNDDGEVRLLPRVSQEELAAMTGSSRESVARVLADLRRSGLLRTDRRQLVLVDIEGLRARS